MVTREGGACEEVTGSFLRVNFAERDDPASEEARRTVERLGAVELSCVPEVEPLEEAHYLVGMDSDHHSLCAFTERALSDLRGLGFQVEVDQAYPYRTLQGDAAFYMDVVPAPKKVEQYRLDLGVEVSGERVSLLPFLLHLLGEAEEKSLRSVMRRAVFAVPLGNGQHVAIPEGRVKLLLSVLLELYGGKKPANAAELCFPKVRAAALGKLCRELGTRERVTAPRDMDPLLFPKEPVTPRPEGLRATLREYQEEGIRFLAGLRQKGLGGVLADDMGLGKTLQTIAHLLSEKEAGRLLKPALIVAPKSLAENWRRECHKFAPGLRVGMVNGRARGAVWKSALSHDVLVTTYAIAMRDEGALRSLSFSTLVVDEAQTIKNIRSQIHQALRNVRAEHRLALTGTPIENHLGELWALFHFLSPGLLGDELSFRRNYRVPIEERGDTERLELLREQIAPYVLRRLKRDVVRELPEKTELYRPIVLEGAQRDLYENIRIAAHAEVRRVIAARGLAQSTVPVLGALLKLRQVCCDPRLIPLTAAREVAESAKLEEAISLITALRAGGHRILLFSQFASMLALLGKALEERGISYVTLTGATENRASLVDTFERGHATVFLISLKAGGTGLNLTSADAVIHYDPWWNPSAQAQATDRAYRIGQTRPVLVYNLYVAGSVEERVLALQKKKRWLSGSLLGDTSALSPMTEGDVHELFAPLAD